MIGVFVSFTLSQAGMVLRWRRERGPGWRTSAAVNGTGALVTGIVLIVVAMTKAREGAWIILLLIPLNVLLFRVTRRHYRVVARIIGDRVVGTQGTPVEVLGRMIHKQLYPDLWEVRNRLTALAKESD